MAPAKLGDLTRQEIKRKRLAARNSYGPAPQAFEILDLRLHALDFAVVPAQVMDKHFACRGQANAARPAVE